MAEEEKEESEAVKAVRKALKDQFPDPLPPAQVRALRSPLDLSDSKPVAPDPPKERPRMSDSSQLNGQYRALETRVEDLRGSYHELRSDMDNRFSLLSAEIAKSADNTNARLDRVMERIEASRTNGGDLTRYGTVIAVIATVMISVIGGFVTLENNSINASIAGLAANVDKNFGRVEGATAELRNNTVGRNELDYRINGNRDSIKSEGEVQTTHSQQIAGLVADARNLHDDVERMKGDIVTRRENEGHWEDLNGRVNLLSTRLTEAIKAAGGGDLGDQLKQLRDQVNDFQRKFIAVPAFPKYNDK